MAARKATRVTLKKRESLKESYWLEFNSLVEYDSDGDSCVLNQVGHPENQPGDVAHLESSCFLSREAAIKLRDLLTEIIDVTA